MGLIEITFNESYIMKKPDTSKLTRMEVNNEKDYRLFRHSCAGLGSKKLTQNKTSFYRQCHDAIESTKYLQIL